MKPILRGHFHQAMFFVALGACAVLIHMSPAGVARVGTIVYSFGVLAMFGISALYHRINWSPEKRAFFKKLDHSAIYLMIAGTFTPVCLLALSEPSGTRLLLSIWIVAVVGLLQSIFFVNLPKLVSASIYLVAGYMVLPYIQELAPELGTRGLALLIGGGIAYSVGALAYGFKWPGKNARVFGYHEVFHLLVNVGAVFHFMLIYSLI